MKSFLFLFLLLPHCLVAKEQVSLGVGVFTPSLAIDVSNSTSSKDIQLSPNNSSATKFIGSYGRLGFSLSQKNPQNIDSLRVPLKSSYEDLQISFFGKKRHFVFYYQEYKGYYVSNAESISPSYTDISNESLFKDMETRSLGFSVISVNEPEKLQMESSFGISKEHKNPGGSWLWLTGVSLNNVKSPTSGFAPSYADSNFDSFKNLRSVESLSAALSGGYGYTYFYDSFFASIVVTLGLAGQKNWIKRVTKTESSLKIASTSMAGISFGYNGSKHKLNLQLLAITQQMNLVDDRISNTTMNTGLVYSYKIGQYEVPWLNKVSAYFE